MVTVDNRAEAGAMYSLHVTPFCSVGLQASKPNFMAKSVNLAETVNPKPPDVTINKKRQIKRVKNKKLDGNGTVTPKKRPARGKFLCWFLHRSATF